jgi:hypothetical protein
VLLGDQRLATVLNNVPPSGAASGAPPTAAVVPPGSQAMCGARRERLSQMFGSGTYVCEWLERRTRTAVKQLALPVPEQLV